MIIINIMICIVYCYIHIYIYIFIHIWHYILAKICVLCNPVRLKEPTDEITVSKTAVRF